MSDPIWYRSLYFRIASGFVVLLATLLAVQGLAFMWMTGRMTELFPSRSPAQVAAAIAADVGAMLDDPAVTDLPGEINRQDYSSFRGYVVALADGRVVESTRVPPPPQLVRSARARALAGRGGGSIDPNRFRGRRGDRSDWPDGPGRGWGRGDGLPDGWGGRGGRGGGPPGGGGTEYASILVNGAFAGVVAVPIEAPPWFVTVRRLGPTLAVVALVLLAAGTAVGAFVIVGPTRRRLQQLQEAARALGAGEPGVRAPETGGDEVSALSHTFNAMASQLESRTQALEQANHTRRQLLADVSHELMTPLAAIRGYVETLGMDDVPLDAGTRSRYLGIVNEEAGRLEDIIGDLLDLARLEGGGGTLRREAVSVAQLLARVRDRHAPAIAERAISLTTSKDPALETVPGDANRIEQALQNLVANAVRHAPTGGRVIVTAARQGNDVVLRVEDSGPGIPPEQLSRVFDRFYKVDESRTGTEVPSGSGLGLSIVRAIVARHGGTVTASNVDGAGAMFEIVLPGRGT